MKNISEFRLLLERTNKSVIITHFRPDADALGSSLGMAIYLKKKGHTVSVVTPSKYPDFLSWMPGHSAVIKLSNGNHEQEHNAEKLLVDADIIFCLDFSNLDRIHGLGDIVKKSTAKKILIDHHLEPDQFADFEYWDPKAASTAGLVFDFIQNMGDEATINSDMANCLYAGLMTDTGGFRHSNTTQKEFLTASKLVGAGAVPSYVSKMIYDMNTLSKIRLMGFILYKKLNVVPEYNMAYIMIHTDDIKRFNVKTGDTEGLVNYGLSIAKVQFAVLMYDRTTEIKLSFRSIADFPANEIAKKYFNGGGHKNAAGGSSKTTLEETLKKLLSILPEYKKQLNEIP